MALKLTDRVVETTQTTGTGTIDLLGAQTGFRTFGSDLEDGDTTPYVIVDDPNEPTTYEYGIGTWTDGSPNTLARTTIHGSSNGGNAISLQSGQTYVVTGSPIASVLLTTQDKQSSPTDTTPGRLLLTDAVADQTQTDAAAALLLTADRLAASAGFPFANMPLVDGSPIVESDENANGRYTLFADGTLFCTSPEITDASVNVSISYGGGFAGNPTEWTFPYAAITTDNMVVTASARSSNHFMGTVVGYSTTSCTPRVARVSSATVSTAYIAGMIGRWK